VAEAFTFANVANSTFAREATWRMKNEWPPASGPAKTEDFE